MQRLGLIFKLGIWVAHVLTERYERYLLDVKATIHFYCYRRQKVGCLQHVKRKRSWSKKNEPAQTTSKPDIHQKKFVSWDFKGIVYFELLPDNTTIKPEVYCNQLDKLSDALKENRPELVKEMV